MVLLIYKDVFPIFIILVIVGTLITKSSDQPMVYFIFDLTISIHIMIKSTARDTGPKRQARGQALSILTFALLRQEFE